ncbi:HPP family protein [Candidatus Margulisiibacteriota bacterium]
MRKVKEIMTRDLTSVTEDTPLKEVAELLSLKALSGIPVVNNKNEVTGYISEKDIVYSIFPEKIKFDNPDVISLSNLTQVVKKIGVVGQAKVKDFMDVNVFCVTEETAVPDAAEIMLTKDYMRLPVVRRRRLVGMIDRSSLSMIVLEEGSLE